MVSWPLRTSLSGNVYRTDQFAHVNKSSEQRWYLEVRSKSKLLADPDEPLSGVILVPPDRVSVVHGELMVEVVITLPDGD